jgi:hypothetical protein
MERESMEFQSISFSELLLLVLTMVLHHHHRHHHHPYHLVLVWYLMFYRVLIVLRDLLVPKEENECARNIFCDLL